MDDQLFKRAMGKFATGVTVVTTEVGENVHGMTANAFMSVSLDPKLIVISVANKAMMKGYLDNAGSFAISMLADNQADLSMYFAGQKKDDKSVEFDVFDNMPVLHGAIATITCDVHNTHLEGDHTLYIGRVRDIRVDDEGKPLAYFSGKYYDLA
ncbi:flavin reductase family protein [Bacillus sp. H-16]|uniref:flavin reductase family protein n=1 Tax=Alteribacter salitolerans TaxID=2912333 RepID=UPI001966AD80|nr:flavin reductase family protein [Alteribacter salitolerans]MBM7094885.1 flavin reductase family protein [Alteribacter salitolerans]